MPHVKTDLLFLVKEGVMVPGGLGVRGFSLISPFTLKTQNFLLPVFSCPDIPSPVSAPIFVA